MNWLQNIFYGRNGPDALSYAVLAVGGVMLLTARWVFRLVPLALAGMGCLLVFFFRIFSTNIYKRRAENIRFIDFFSRIKAWVLLRLRMLREIKTHRYLRCPSCGQHLRVPKGKGKIGIRCARCNTEFIRKV